MKTYLVGGAVRDKLMGNSIQDRDWVVVGATPEQMLAQGFLPVGKDFPVFLHPDTKEEYALARTERKSGHGYTGFDVYAAPEVTLEEDLARRDLTINAMAMDESGDLFDPYGGQQDLANRCLRHVTDAFQEDPLRVLRVARFKAKYHHLSFKVHDSTQMLMRRLAESGELETLVAERVWVEISKALMEVTPSQFFYTLQTCGALAILFPEIDKLFGVPQRQDYHPEIDAGIHTMMVLDMAANMQLELDARFAVLVHDLGKAETPTELLPSHHGHESRSVRLINSLCARYRVPRKNHDLAILVAKYHSHAHRAFDLKPSTVLELLENLDAFRRPQRLTSFLYACKADARGRKGFEKEKYPQLNYLLSAFDCARNISVQPLLLEGLKGQEINEALKRKRTQAIAMLKSELMDTLKKDNEQEHSQD